MRLQGSLNRKASAPSVLRQELLLSLQDAWKHQIRYFRNRTLHEERTVSPLSTTPLWFGLYISFCSWLLFLSWLKHIWGKNIFKYFFQKQRTWHFLILKNNSAWDLFCVLDLFFFFQFNVLFLFIIFVVPLVFLLVSFVVLVCLLFCSRLTSVGATPICTNAHAGCHVLSLSNLFDRVIQHSARMHGISNDLHSEFVSLLMQFVWQRVSNDFYQISLIL